MSVGLPGAQTFLNGFTSSVSSPKTKSIFWTTTRKIDVAVGAGTVVSGILGWQKVLCFTVLSVVGWKILLGAAAIGGLYFLGRGIMYCFYRRCNSDTKLLSGNTNVANVDTIKYDLSEKTEEHQRLLLETSLSAEAVEASSRAVSQPYFLHGISPDHPRGGDASQTPAAVSTPVTVPTPAAVSRHDYGGDAKGDAPGESPLQATQFGEAAITSSPQCVPLPPFPSIQRKDKTRITIETVIDYCCQLGINGCKKIQELESLLEQLNKKLFEQGAVHVTLPIYWLKVIKFYLECTTEGQVRKQFVDRHSYWNAVVTFCNERSIDLQIHSTKYNEDIKDLVSVPHLEHIKAAYKIFHPEDRANALKV